MIPEDPTCQYKWRHDLQPLAHLEQKERKGPMPNRKRDFVASWPKVMHRLEAGVIEADKQHYAAPASMG